MSIVVVTQVFAQDKTEHKPVEKLLNGIISLFGLVILVYTIYRIFQEFGEFANLQTLKSFLLPIILTILYIPFLYFVALWSLYENIILSLSRRLKKKKHKKYLKKYLKKKLFSHFLFNRKKLETFHKEMRFEPIMNKKDIKRIFKVYTD